MKELKKFKIIYLGTPTIALPPLTSLIENGFNIIGVFCQPDKKSGRGKNIEAPPVKIIAEKYNIPVFQPKNKEELHKIISELKPDLAIVFAYGIIIPEKTLELVQYNFLNIHPSLLPKYRGPSPIQSAILSGDKKTGVSIIKITNITDAGPVLTQKEISINDKEDSVSLAKKLSAEGAKLLIGVVPSWLENKIIPEKQNEKSVTYTTLFKKEDGKIQWQKEAVKLEAEIRAFTTWPGSYFNLENKNFKIIEARAQANNFSNTSGQISFENNKILIQTGNGILDIIKIQPEGKKTVTAKEFINGYPWVNNKILK